MAYLCNANHSKIRDNPMKKILFVILAAMLTGIIASCTSNQHCAAYGEKQRYQMERR